MNVSIETPLVTVEIVDNDTLVSSPPVSVRDEVVDESAGTAVVPVILGAASASTITVGYTTVSGTATAGADFTAVSGTLTFGAGETAHNIVVPIIDDSVAEQPETFTVVLSNPTNATISDDTGVVTIEDDEPATFTPGSPSITGTPTTGSTLAAVTGTWTPTPTSFTYRWLRNGVATGTTTSTYVVSNDDAGQPITVEITAHKNGFNDQSATSAAVTGQGVFTAPLPTTSGNLSVGSTLTAALGAWDPSPTTVAYQWFRGSTAIVGATGASYTITSDDVGSRLAVEVTGSTPGYMSATRSKRGDGGRAVDLAWTHRRWCRRGCWRRRVGAAHGRWVVRAVGSA